MTDQLNVDICVIGAGAGGLSVAAGASQMGASTVLVEKAVMGGDCLNYGCVPSKSLLAAAHAATAVRRAGRFGIEAADPAINARDVFAHIRKVIRSIEPNDSVERFEGLGVRVLRGTARFTGPREVAVDDVRITARRFVIATGSSPLVPPIPGLDAVSFLTNETVFEGPDLPQHLIIVGGGPIGVELAQAHRQLGVGVTLFEQVAILPQDDPELVDVVRQRLIADGVEIHEGKAVRSVENTAAGIAVAANGDTGEATVEGSHLLLAVGRKTNLDGLGLDEAGIRYSAKGIEVDRQLRTSNKRVFAIGDAAGGLQFTHVAGHHAGVVIKNALFRLPAKADTQAVPWVTFTAPELAQVGMTEDAARRSGRDFRILRWPFHENDRARAEANIDGLIKAIVTPKGRVLGCAIVGPSAGELIQSWVLAMDRKIKIGALAQTIVPYPTLGEVSKRAAGSFYAPSLFSERTRKIVRFLSRFG